MPQDPSPARQGCCSAFLLCGLRFCVAVFLLAVAVPGGRGESSRIPAAPEGMVETGAPSFAVMGSATLGLSSAPTDLQLLPDGRILVVGRREIAVGDGVRWQVFHAHEDHDASYGTLAIDSAGRIYHGIEGGIARLDLGADAHWRSTKVTDLPSGSGVETSTMTTVRTTDDNWYWHGGSGAVVAWRPGATPRIAGTVSSVEHIFTVGRDTYISEQASGGLFRVQPEDGSVERIAAAPHLASETVTSSVQFAPGVVLAGTNAGGIKLFDGLRFQPFSEARLLSGEHRINDLCAVGESFFAAAIDTVGIVFFDRKGLVVQVLERALDHRLGRVHQLRSTRDGVLWARLNEDFPRAGFPSPISHFEPLLASSLAYAKPVRHEGRLWLLADGRAMRGLYDEAGRLERFVNDAPAGRYIFHLKVVDDELFATSDAGIFVRRGADWTLVAAGVVNARVGLGRQTTGRVLYVARDEIGVLTRTPSGFDTQRTFVPNLGDCYSSVEEASGIVWLELGAGGVARLDPRPAQPTIEFFGPSDGLANGWTEIYAVEGIARFHLPNHLYRFDEATRRFVEDHELLARHPALLLAHGRPLTDQQGKLWYTLLGVGYRSPFPASASEGEPQPIPVGFGPSEYTIEENGVVWMFSNHWLARFDPRMAPPPAAPLRAIVTSVQFTGSRRHVFSPANELDPIVYTDNSLVFSFVAPANPFAEALSFEVLLEGASAQWVSTGSVGTATFNRLKEGDYIFRVRPVVAGKPGEEARIAFTVRPPWYRTTLAWALYSASAFLLVGFAAWFASYLQRRENDRLEHLVAVRTDELNTSNQRLGRQIHETTEKSAALAASEERYRLLNAELEHRVRERTAELSLSNEELIQRESLFRLIFEHAPVGILWKRADLGDMYHFNSTFRRILRLPVNAPADDRLLETLAHPEDAPRLVRMYRIIATGEADSFTIEQRFVLHDATVVWAALSVAVVRDKQGHIIQDIGILEDISGRKKAEAELATTYKNLMEASRMAGMAEVATGVLHNVGNVLNSLNVSANLIADGIRQSKADSLVRLSALLHDRAADLGDFLARDPKGRLVPEMLDKLARHSVTERDWLVKEIASMQRNIDHIKEIVAMQQSYATVIGVVETLDASTLFEDALRMNTAALMRHDVTVIREFLPTPPVRVEKGKVLQILINLIRNAKYACDDAQLPEGTQKIMIVRVEPAENGCVRLIVRDNGVGIAPENLTRIFAHGFTTRAYGHGFGLHSSALAAKEMKGSLTASSDGPGKGATFVLEIPAADPAPPAAGGASRTGLPEVTRDPASRAPFPLGGQKNGK